MTEFHIRPLDMNANIRAFRCGHDALGEYLRRFASQDVKRGIARVFVAVPENDVRQVAGFFTLSAGSVSATELPDAIRRKLPRYPVPVAMLGRLAVHSDFQGKGLGSILLADACIKVEQASAILAVAGIVVDAKDEVVTAFYRYFGFVDLPGRTGRLLLPRKAFPKI